MTKIIGTCGPAGSGKSTVANYLVEHYGARRYAFADPLKQICIRTLDFADEQLNRTQAQKEAVDPRYGFSARWFIQRLGTEGVRAVLGPDFWWRYCLSRIARDAPGVAVIEDVRFVNEATGVMYPSPTSETVVITDDLVTEIAWYTLAGTRSPPDFVERLGAAFRCTLPTEITLGGSDQEPGFVWRLEPPRFAATADSNHQSEAEWCKCPYDLRIAPRKHGLFELYDLVDRAAHFCYLTSTRRADAAA
jgi:hypothetical protein